MTTELSTGCIDLMGEHSRVAEWSAQLPLPHLALVLTISYHPLPSDLQLERQTLRSPFHLTRLSVRS